MISHRWPYIKITGNKMQIAESTLRQIIREEILKEDVRRRGDQWCAYVDDKLTAAEKEASPGRHKGKAVGAVQRTPDGKIRMKARACYASKKKANNAMAAAMMEGILQELEEIEDELLQDPLHHCRRHRVVRLLLRSVAGASLHPDRKSVV